MYSGSILGNLRPLGGLGISRRSRCSVGSNLGYLGDLGMSRYSILETEIGG